MKSIKNKFILFTLLIIVIPFTISNVVSYYFMYNNYIEKIKEDNLTLSKSISSNISEFIDKAYCITNDIANIDEIKSFYTIKSTKCC